MSVLKFPNKVLLTQCEEVYSFDTLILETLDKMWKVMKENRGVGLAANQIGYQLDMFVMEGPDGKRLDLINPYIRARSMESISLKEGCLSAPGEFVVVPGRAKWVLVHYQNIEGKRRSIVLNGIYAICAQHEIEHLDGKSFMEHKSIPKDIRKGLSKRWGLKR